MNVLEKILEEIESLHNKILKDKFAEQVTEQEIDSLVKVKEIIRSHMDEVPKCGECSRRKWYQKGYNDSKDINVRNNDELIDRKALKEKIENLRMTITGMRNGKTITAKALEEYKKSILRIIDEQQTENNDGWIPVEDRLPEDGQEVLVWYEYFRYGEYNRMFETYGIGWQFDGYWSGDVSGTKARCIAWQPLPEPYRHKDIPTEKNTQQEMEDFWRDK